MALENKITKAVLSAMKYLENSKNLITENNQDALANHVWKASAELEYALFLFSILRKNEDHSWKVDLKSKKLEIAPAIASTEGLLENARTGFENGNFLEAHKKIWIARGYLLKVQNVLEKKRR